MQITDALTSCAQQLATSVSQWNYAVNEFLQQIKEQQKVSKKSWSFFAIFYFIVANQLIK